MTDNLPETTHGGQVPVGTQEPIPDPGLPEHQWRPTDVDPKAERRAERQVAALFVVAILGAIGVHRQLCDLQGRRHH